MSFNSIKRLTRAVVITYSFAFLFLNYFLSAFVILRSSHGYHKLTRRSLNRAKERTKKKDLSFLPRDRAEIGRLWVASRACWLRIQLMWQSIFTKWVSVSPTSGTSITSLITAFWTEKDNGHFGEKRHNNDLQACPEGKILLTSCISRAILLAIFFSAFLKKKKILAPGFDSRAGSASLCRYISCAVFEGSLEDELYSKSPLHP